MDFLISSTRSCKTFETLVRQRMEDSSLQQGINLMNLRKDLEKEVKEAKDSKDLKNLSSEQKDVLEKHSGDPGEPTKKIQDFTSLENNLMVTTEPEVLPFPYTETKLRPEAPPFTPECVSPDPEPAYGEPETENSCFVNVELKLPNEGDEVYPEPEIQPAVNQQKDVKEIKDGRLKPFSLTFTTQHKKSTPSVEISEIIDEEEPTVHVQPTTSTASETGDPPIIERVNILSPAFFLGNKTQIIVLVASIVVCVILVIFVLV